jgi:hypothetical protein
MLQRFAGKCISVTQAIPNARLFLNACYQALSVPSTLLALTSDLTYELCFWQRIHDFSGTKLWWPEHHVILRQSIFTDASLSRWGAIIQHQGSELEFSGIWPDHIRHAQPPIHINTLELWAVSYFLESAVTHWPDIFVNTRLDIGIDNTSAIYSILKQGTRNPQMLQPLRAIFEQLVAYNIRLQPFYINTAINPADAPSRHHDRYEFKLTRAAFEYINATFGPHTVDAFASSVTTQLPKFYSRYIEPGSSGLNAFAQPYHGENVYAFPPTALLPYFIRLLQEQAATATVIAEEIYPLPAYWPILLTLCNNQCFCIVPKGSYSLLRPSRNGWTQLRAPHNLWAMRFSF